MTSPCVALKNALLNLHKQKTFTFKDVRYKTQIKAANGGWQPTLARWSRRRDKGYRTLYNALNTFFFNVAKHIIVVCLLWNTHPSLQYSSRSFIHASLCDFFLSPHVHPALSLLPLALATEYTLSQHWLARHHGKIHKHWVATANINPFTAAMLFQNNESAKLETFKTFCLLFFALTHGRIGSRCVVGPENILFVSTSVHLSPWTFYWLRQWRS